jgi:hypothetical protein
MEDDDSSQPDELRAVPVITIFEDWIKNAQDEVAMSSNYGYGKQPYPAMAIAHIQIRSLLSDFTEKVEEFEENERKIDAKYGGSPLEKNYEMTYNEAYERVKNLLDLWREGGPGYIDKKYDYYQPMSADYLDFVEWGEDD